MSKQSSFFVWKVNRACEWGEVCDTCWL